MGYEDASKLDNELMGGKAADAYNFDIDILNQAIGEITQKDKARVRDVTSFYNDYKESIRNVSKVIKNGGYACYTNSLSKSENRFRYSLIKKYEKINV